MNLITSSVPGYRWPALPSAEANAMLAMQFQLEHSQWDEPDQILRNQLSQLSLLYNHAYKTIDLYTQKYRKAGLKKGHQIISIDEWQALPIITRSEIQEAGEHFVSKAVPVEHGPTRSIQTSGSTGKPIVIHSTGIVNFFWNVFTLREHLWHQRDFTKKLGIIRWIDNANEALAPNGLHRKGWGHSTDVAFKTGSASILNLRCNLREQYEWLKREKPHYLLTYATNALALAQYFQELGESLPSLKQVRTLSEAFGSELRTTCRDVWNAQVIDMYSARETGYLALQCPEHEHYHVQSENALIEIVDEAGNPCKPGQIGRVIISTLHNYASPLLRYDIGDYAELGESCSCGRGLPIIKRIAGRVRNMLVLPNGERFWPLFGPSKCAAVAPIKQIQCVQQDYTKLEIRMVVERPLT
ncbi:MAG: AMP-binding protein, partial [Sedimenticola sp.]|nr:AMP-binding protein [Sedimenticola sp.]